MAYTREEILGILAGAPEVLASMGSSMATLPVALLGGAGNLVARRAFGEGQETAGKGGEEQFKRFMQAGTYIPRSGAGRDAMSLLSHAIERAKIPPYVPGIGRMRIPKMDEAVVGSAKAAEPALRAMTMQPGTDIPRGALAAIKPQPGGHWSPSSGEKLKSLLTAGEGVEGLDFTGTTTPFAQWAEKQTQRWLNRHAGTDRDTARELVYGHWNDTTTFEKMVDKSLKKKRYAGVEGLDTPPLARAGEEYWTLDPTPRLAEVFSHAGDFARGIDPGDLARMDLPTLLRKVHEADRRQVVTTGKNASSREAALAKILEEHPGGAFLEGEGGRRWLEFKQGMDPEKIKLGLSVDTCVGQHCIAQAAHGRPQWGYPGFVPLRDLISGRPMKELHPESNLPDSTSYINQIIRGEGSAYSLRDKSGQPLATTFVTSRAPAGIARSDVRSKIMTPKEYLKWQGSQRESGVDIEQRMRLPSGQARVEGQAPEGGALRANVHAEGGHVVPARGALGPEQIQSIIEMFPQYKVALEALAIKRRNELDQMKGRMNLGVPPEYAQDISALLGKLDLGTPPVSGSGKRDLMRSGVGLSGKRGITIQEMMQIPENMRALPEVDPMVSEVVGKLLRKKGLTGMSTKETSALEQMVQHLMGR